MLNNRGIGLNGFLPWPPLKKDFDHYMTLTSKTSTKDKKVVNIKGRVTWDESCLIEKNRPSVMNIVVSNSLKECPERVSYVVPSFSEAHKLASQLYHKGVIESIWILGGTAVYKDAVKSDFCERVYLTRIHAHYECDRFFPSFEDDFELIKVPEVDSSIQEENDVKFEFLVYERKRNLHFPNC